MSTPSTAAPVKKTFNPLLTWKDPQLTAKVFGSIFSSLIVLKYVNLLNLFFRLASIVLFISAVAEYAGKLVTGTGFITKFRPAYTKDFSSQTSQYLNKVIEKLPSVEENGQKLLYSFNIENTLKASGILYVLFKITSWVSVYNLVLLSTISAFTLPLVYETYQTEINQAVSQGYEVGKAKAEELTKVGYEKAEPILKQLDEKLGPVSKFVKQKYQVRTASSTVSEGQSTGFTSGSSVSESIPVNTKVSSAETELKSSFPEVPKTSPLAEQVTSDKVDVDDLKNDILKNKQTATPNF
ncbi:hypothetical protein WICMUC_001739 [Wickerhamomyces mucosus]|uniref:Reticulon-like protein n=1 Tax=Wickerhamomyces mucosus TaxID=1378264 RepID=A0A9P8PSU9_9ASCO|nr:hypothetical protein WICMUC_001739 [Wickerhamomyces mucosus]